MLGWTASSTRITGNWPGMVLETLRIATIVRSLQNWYSNKSRALLELSGGCFCLLHSPAVAKVSKPFWVMHDS